MTFNDPGTAGPYCYKYSTNPNFQIVIQETKSRYELAATGSGRILLGWKRETCGYPFSSASKILNHLPSRIVETLWHANWNQESCDVRHGTSSLKKLVSVQKTQNGRAGPPVFVLS
ncbi:MAG: hypothetical protein C5B54_06755 [Acidobacteria bacterium]|nr:MAG: hypothetical protein C5B54_06755 [Acidobacteriota bacterium]